MITIDGLTIGARSIDVSENQIVPHITIGELLQYVVVKESC